MKALYTVEMGNRATGQLGRVAIFDDPMPVVGEEDLLIQVAYAAICGSDGHILKGLDGPMGEYIRSRLPMPCGHEVSGVVVEAGPAAAAAGWKPGDRVTCNYTHFCGSCYWCRTGRENFCSNPKTSANAMREYICWHMSQVYKIPDGVPLKHAALTEPLSIAFGAVEMAKVRMGSRVAVFGGGGIGLMAMQLARNAGAGQVVLIEPVAAKRQLGLELGADDVWDPVNEDICAKAAAATNGLGFDSVIEASGASSAAETALRILSKDGDVVYFAMYNPTFKLEVNLFEELYQNQKHLHGMYTTADVFDRVIPMLQRIQLEPLIQKVYSLDDHEQAFADQLSGKYAKVVFQCSDIE